MGKQTFAIRFTEYVCIEAYNNPCNDLFEGISSYQWLVGKKSDFFYLPLSFASIYLRQTPDVISHNNVSGNCQTQTIKRGKQRTFSFQSHQLLPHFSAINVSRSMFPCQTQKQLFCKLFKLLFLVLCFYLFNCKTSGLRKITQMKLLFICIMSRSCF